MGKGERARGREPGEPRPEARAVGQAGAGGQGGPRCTAPVTCSWTEGSLRLERRRLEGCLPGEANVQFAGRSGLSFYAWAGSSQPSPTLPPTPPPADHAPRPLPPPTSLQPASSLLNPQRSSPGPSLAKCQEGGSPCTPGPSEGNGGAERGAVFLPPLWKLPSAHRGRGSCPL